MMGRNAGHHDMYRPSLCPTMKTIKMNQHISKNPTSWKRCESRRPVCVWAVWRRAAQGWAARRAIIRLPDASSRPKPQRSTCSRTAEDTGEGWRGRSGSRRPVCMWAVWRQAAQGWAARRVIIRSPGARSDHEHNGRHAHARRGARARLGGDERCNTSAEDRTGKRACGDESEARARRGRERPAAGRGSARRARKGATGFDLKRTECPN